jgi:hypothetical protein
VVEMWAWVHFSSPAADSADLSYSLYSICQPFCSTQV